jgi:hypothetical protein
MKVRVGSSSQTDEIGLEIESVDAAEYEAARAAADIGCDQLPKGMLGMSPSR